MNYKDFKKTLQEDDHFGRTTTPRPGPSKLMSIGGIAKQDKNPQFSGIKPEYGGIGVIKPKAIPKGDGTFMFKARECPNCAGKQPEIEKHHPSPSKVMLPTKQNMFGKSAGLRHKTAGEPQSKTEMGGKVLSLDSPNIPGYKGNTATCIHCGHQWNANSHKKPTTIKDTGGERHYVDVANKFKKLAEKPTPTHKNYSPAHVLPQGEHKTSKDLNTAIASKVSASHVKPEVAKDLKLATEPKEVKAPKTPSKIQGHQMTPNKPLSLLGHLAQAKVKSRKVLMINKYFGFNDLQAKNEQDLIQDLVDEDIQIYGMDVYYIPQNLIALNPIFGEDPLSTFTNYYTLEMYFNTPERFEGSININKFAGLTNFLTTNFIVSSRRYIEEVQKITLTNLNPLQNQRPLQGDILYVPMTRDFWEIKIVSAVNPIFDLGKVAMWRLDVEKWIYSSQVIDTGVPELDGLNLFGYEDGIPSTDLVHDNTHLDTETTPIFDNTNPDPFTDGNIV